MLLSTVIGQNHKVALENPTYKQAYRLFKSLSYDVCTVDMDEKGMKVADLKSSGADIAFGDAFPSVSAGNRNAHETQDGTA